MRSCAGACSRREIQYLMDLGVNLWITKLWKFIRTSCGGDAGPQPRRASGGVPRPPPAAPGATQSLGEVGLGPAGVRPAKDWAHRTQGLIEISI